MFIHRSACIWVVSVQLVINSMRHLSLRLVCIIVGPLWLKSAVQDKVLQQGAIPEALVTKVRCAWLSPLTRGSSWGHNAQSPLCKMKSPTRGSFWGPLWSKSTVQDEVLQWGANYEAICGRSPLRMTKSSEKGQFLRPLWSKSAMQDEVLQQGADPWGPCGWSPMWAIKSTNKGQTMRPLVGQVSCARQRPPLRGRHFVETLPEGYIRNVPLPWVPRVQSANSSVQIHTIPDYYKTMYKVPTYISPCSRVESAAYAYSPAWHAIAFNN